MSYLILSALAFYGSVGSFEEHLNALNFSRVSTNLIEVLGTTPLSLLTYGLPDAESTEHDELVNYAEDSLTCVCLGYRSAKSLRATCPRLIGKYLQHNRSTPMGFMEGTMLQKSCIIIDSQLRKFTALADSIGRNPFWYSATSSSLSRPGGFAITNDAIGVAQSGLVDALTLTAIKPSQGIVFDISSSEMLDVVLGVTQNNSSLRSRSRSSALLTVREESITLLGSLFESVYAQLEETAYDAANWVEHADRLSVSSSLMSCAVSSIVRNRTVIYSSPRTLRSRVSDNGIMPTRMFAYLQGA